MTRPPVRHIAAGENQASSKSARHLVDLADDVVSSSRDANCLLWDIPEGPPVLSQPAAKILGDIVLRYLGAKEKRV
jgi:hypothetical protein